MTEELVDISGLTKAEVLRALVNDGVVLGMGYLQDIGRPMTLEEAAALIVRGDDHARNFDLAKDTYDRGREQGRLYFDYVVGKPIKCEIGGDDLDPWGYDRDNGSGAAKRAIDKLRASKAAAV